MPLQRHQYRWRSSILLFSRLLFIGFVTGCSGSESASESTTLQKTNALTRFSAIEHITIDEQINYPKSNICEVPKPQWSDLEAILENGIVDRNLVKRMGVGSISILADGKKYHWFLLEINDDELGLQITTNEFWRGISRRDLARFVEECVARNSEPK